jgi:MFS family permease
MLYVFAVVYGLFSGLATFSISINAEYFGVKELGAISGIGLFGNAIGSAIGPVLAGLIYDRIGNYQLTFLLCAIAGVGSVTLMWLLKPTRINYNLTNNELKQKSSVPSAED